MLNGSEVSLSALLTDNSHDIWVHLGTLLTYVSAQIQCYNLGLGSDYYIIWEVCGIDVGASCATLLLVLVCSCLVDYCLKPFKSQS